MKVLVYNRFIQPAYSRSIPADWFDSDVNDAFAYIGWRTMAYGPVEMSFCSPIKYKFTKPTPCYRIIRLFIVTPPADITTCPMTVVAGPGGRNPAS